jgi:hypothetical protein
MELYNDRCEKIRPNSEIVKSPIQAKDARKYSSVISVAININSLVFLMWAVLE